MLWPATRLGCCLPPPRAMLRWPKPRPPSQSLHGHTLCPWASPAFASQLLAGYSQQEMKLSQNSQSKVRNIKAQQPEEEDDALGIAHRVRLLATEAAPKAVTMLRFASFNIKVTQNFHQSVYAHLRWKYFVQFWFLLVTLQFLKSTEKDTQG